MNNLEFFSHYLIITDLFLAEIIEYWSWEIEVTLSSAPFDNAAPTKAAILRGAGGTEQLLMPCSSAAFVLSPWAAQKEDPKAGIKAVVT